MELFTPLSRDFCILFYIMMILGFVLFVSTAVGLLLVRIFGKKPIGAGFYYMGIWTIMIYFLFYLQSRILYSMCSKSL